MTNRKNVIEPLASELAEDAEMAELLDLFVGDLSEKIAMIQQSLEEEQWETLKRVAHQIKGSAGGYGYPSLGEAAAGLEGSINAEEGLEALQGSVDALILLCRRAQAGHDVSEQAL